MTESICAEVETLMREVYADTVENLQRILEFSRQTNPDDEQAIKKYAVDTALEMNRKALPWRARIEELLRRMNARGETLFSRRDVLLIER